MSFWSIFRRAKTDERLPEIGLRVTITSRVEAGPDDSRPDNPRFATWEEAMNRKVTDDLLFWIRYCDGAGAETEREIIPKMIRLQAGRSEVKIVAHCLLRGAEREFHSERILAAVNRQTGRSIRDLGGYLRGKY